MEQLSHYLVPIQARYAGEYPSVSSSCRISKVWIQYIPRNIRLITAGIFAVYLGHFNYSLCTHSVHKYG